VGAFLAGRLGSPKAGNAATDTAEPAVNLSFEVLGIVGKWGWAGHRIISLTAWLVGAVEMSTYDLAKLKRLARFFGQLFQLELYAEVSGGLP